MLLAGTILLVSLSALWLLSYEYPAVIGLYVPARALRRNTFKIVVAIFLVSGIFLTKKADVCSSLDAYWGCSSADFYTMMVVVLSSFICLLLLKIFSINGSVLYAVLGSMEAYRIVSGNVESADILLSVLVAHIFAFAISALLRFLSRATLDRCHIHLITLSYYMRWAVILALILAALAIGINWGGFIYAQASLIDSSAPVLMIFSVAVLSIMVLLSSVIRDESDENAGKFSDFSIYTILSVGFSIIIVLFFFSFDTTSGFIGLKPVPLSVGPLVLAAIGGAELVNKRHLVERDEYARESIALIISPFGSMLVAYFLLYLSGREGVLLVNFTVIAAAVLVLAVLGFTAYARRQKKLNDAKDRLVYSQQQQLYEHSRALNDMELKVVLSENQALHNAVEMKKQEVMNVALSIVEQREYLESLNEKVKRLSVAGDAAEQADLIAEISASLKQRLSYDRDVDAQYFSAQAEYLHEDFNAKLAENFPDLTQQERRLATLLRLGFSSKYIATLLNITSKSVEISRYRLRQKLGLSKGDNLVNFIKSI